jgi:hypothetical protein
MQVIRILDLIKLVYKKVKKGRNLGEAKLLEEALHHFRVVRSLFWRMDSLRRSHLEGC